MRATHQNFLKFLQSSHQLIVPIYQRNYSWTEKHCRLLMEDICKIARKERNSHFLGSIVFITPGEYLPAIINQSLLIDGQQRITTIILLLHSIGKIIKDEGIEFELTKEQIENLYIFNSQMTGDLRYKLLLSKKDKETFLNILNEREILEDEDNLSLLKRNYSYFLKKIYSFKDNLKQLFLGIQKLMIVSISLTREYDQPQLIFESLNSTGLDLTQTDLIRNYILIDLDQKQQEEIYNDYWYPMEQFFQAETDQFDRYIRDYLTLRTESIPRIEDIYDDFKNYTEEFIRNANHGASKYGSIKNLLIDIYTFSKYYAKIAFSMENDKDIQNSFNNINRLKVRVAFPFLLQVYCDYDNKIISKETFLEILKIIESYVFRRAICEVPTNSLNKTFVLLIKAIDKKNYLESIKATLILYKKYRIFPTAIEFKKNLLIKDVYGFRNNRFLLDNLEFYRHKEKTLVEECSIEHIMPQNENLSKEWQEELGSNWRNIHEKYKHVIGNLTLTGYNTELGDKSFKEKRDMEGGYKDSVIHLSKDLIYLEHWNEEEIIKRTEKLSDLAILIWPYPEVNPEFLERYKTESTDVEETTYLTIIRDSLKKTLSEEWKFHTMKWRVLIFKETWLNDFKEFYSPKFPFVHYTIDSWINDNGFELSVCFNLDESKYFGGKFDLRKKFTDILDEEINKTELTYRYLENQKNTKFKEVLIEEDNYGDEELKEVADAMVELINTSFKPIQSTINRFKAIYKDEIEVWKNR